jgi:FemAB family protein
MRLQTLGLGDVGGQRVALFDLDPGHLAPEYLDWLRSRQVRKYLESRFEDYSGTALREFVEQCNASTTVLLLGIRRLDRQRHVGNIKLGWDANHMVGDIGIMIGDVDSWGHGFASEAVDLLTRLAFKRLGLRKVVAGIYDGHRGSMRVFQRCGFRVEATLKEHVLLEGVATDVLQMRLLRSEHPEFEPEVAPLPHATHIVENLPFAALLDESGLDAVPRADDPTAWEQVWCGLRYQPVAYARSMLDYQHAYLRGAGQELRDLSLVLRTGGRPCAIWSLTFGGLASDVGLTSAGVAVAAPLFLPDLSPATVKRICTRALALVKGIARYGDIGTVTLQQPAMPDRVSEDASEWHKQLLGAGASLTARHELVADLRPSMAEIRARFRKSFRPLINVGLRSWHVFLLDRTHPDAAVWAEFKQLHHDVVGRSTRNDETWTLQYEMLVAGEAFLVGLRDPASGRLVGGGFFQHTRDEALYAVAAYDRSLFDKPLGHVVQQRAIEAMKALGLTWHRIGERHYPQDIPAPSDKQVAIGHFKQGFASNLFCRYEFNLAIGEEESSAGESAEDSLQKADSP